MTWATDINIYPVSGILPTSILKGETTRAYYIVKNNSSKPQSSIHVRYLPPNVKQILDAEIYHPLLTCNTTFNLAAKYENYDVCILQLEISGPINAHDPDPTHHITLCQGDSDCTGVSDTKYELNIIEGKPNTLKRVVVVNEYMDEHMTSLHPVSYTSADGGFTWHHHNITNNPSIIQAVTCAGNNNQNCTAIGNASSNDGNKTLFLAYTSKDGGINWDTHELGKHWGASGLIAVTCNGKDGEYCVAVGVAKPTDPGWRGPISYTSTDGGSNWIPHFPTPANQGHYSTTLRSVSCSKNGQYCVAIGESEDGFENGHNTLVYVSYTSSDGGNTWAMHVIDKRNNGGNFLHAVSCDGETGQYCVAVGGIVNQPVIYRSTNGGVDWTAYTPEIPKEEIGGILKTISCNGNNNQYCTAAGSVWHHYSNGHYLLMALDPIAYTSTDGGASWKILQGFQFSNNNPGDTEINALTCSNDGKYCTLLAYGVGFYTGGKKFVVPVIGIINTDINFDDPIASNNFTANWRAGRFVHFTDHTKLIENNGIGIS